MQQVVARLRGARRRRHARRIAAARRRRRRLPAARGAPRCGRLIPGTPRGPDDGDAEVAEPDDPESAPAIPAAAVAAHAAAVHRDDTRRADREIWTLAWPVILSQILASSVSLIDIGMLGRLGPHNARGGRLRHADLPADAGGAVRGRHGRRRADVARDRRRRSRARARGARELSRRRGRSPPLLIAGIVLAMPRILLESAQREARRDRRRAAVPAPHDARRRCSSRSRSRSSAASARRATRARRSPSRWS